MALPPTIPTSFVPHSAVTQRQFRGDYSGAFGFFAYTVLGFILLFAIGIFFYGNYLTKVKKDKADEIQAVKIDPKTVEDFVRLRDRLSASETLLDSHVAYSGFFAILEKVLPTTVRFNSVHISVDTKGTPKVEGSGVAKSFNALAAASKAFADDGNIKDAIFSDLSVSGKNNAVAFTLSATLDQKVIDFTP